MRTMDDLGYLRGRAVQEQAAAEAASNPAARDAHERLAARYEAQAIQAAMLKLCSGAAGRIAEIRA